jgi:hypothetical protein
MVSNVVESAEKERREAAISRHVLDLLGRPDVPHTVRVRHLWDGRYRVNVFIGPERAFAEIAHSYFLSVDDNGNIVESAPPIRKRY